MDPDLHKNSGQPTRPQKHAAVTWHDHLVMLLHLAAEIEHGLMVQYLYAGYTLGGDQVPKKHRPMVNRWRETILTIAREEMGHFLMVQNVLCLLGAPANLGRRDFPWDVPFYPFPFKLEPLTMASLSCYTYAEMPSEREFEVPKGRQLPPRYKQFEEKDKKAISKAVRKLVTGGDPHPVEVVYEEIIELIADTKKIPDSAFQEQTFRTQASWDDWGRGYQPPLKMLDAEGNLANTQPKAPASERGANVLIMPIATRTQAVAALRAISEQGEAPHLGADKTGEPSHFDRFLEIYQEFEEIKGWNPAREVAVNPSTRDINNPSRYIAAKPTRDWATLFNIRYRMLLTFLAHNLRLAYAPENGSGEPNLRAMLMHKVFGEMYNLKAIAGLLVKMPMRDKASHAKGLKHAGAFAGPPFEMPYDTTLPHLEADTWRLHLELTQRSILLCEDLLSTPEGEGKEYLKTILDLDRQSVAWIKQILAGLSATERHRSS